MPVARAFIPLAFLTACATVAVSAAQTPPPQSQTQKKGSGDVFVVGTTQTVDPNTDASKPVPPKPAPAVVKLPDPPADQIPKIIDAFSTKERTFRTLMRDSYTYTETISMQELDDSGQPVGNFQQVNDIVYTPSGARQIICTYCPQPQLKNVNITQQDIDDMFNMNMYTLSVDELPQYNVTYIDHEPLDSITAYVFAIAPKTLIKGKRYFQGKVYVDDRDLMIVKSAGKVVPDEYDKHGNPTNTFLPFQVWRQEIDGKYWFPVYTLMEGKVPPAAPGDMPTPLRMVIQFKDYKQFRATTRIVGVVPLDQTTPPATPPPAAPPAVPAKTPPCANPPCHN